MSNMPTWHGVSPDPYTDPQAKEAFGVIDDYLRRLNFFLEPTSLASAVSAGGGGGGVTSHHALTDLTTYDDHSQYLLLAGRSNHQNAYGGTASGGYFHLFAHSSAAAPYSYCYLQHDMASIGHSIDAEPAFCSYPGTDTNIRAVEDIYVYAEHGLTLRAITGSEWYLYDGGGSGHTGISVFLDKETNGGCVRVLPGSSQTHNMMEWYKTASLGGTLGCFVSANCDIVGSAVKGIDTGGLLLAGCTASAYGGNVQLNYHLDSDLTTIYYRAGSHVFYNRASSASASSIFEIDPNPTSRYARFSMWGYQDLVRVSTLGSNYALHVNASTCVTDTSYSGLIWVERGYSGSTVQGYHLMKFTRSQRESPEGDTEAGILSYIDASGAWHGPVYASGLTGLPNHIHSSATDQGGYLYATAITDLGALATATTPLSISLGGIGATSLVAADIITKVGTAYNLASQVGDFSAVELVASGHPAGIYRVGAYLYCTLAGGTGAKTSLKVGFDDDVASRSMYLAMNANGGAMNYLMNLTATTQTYGGSLVFYSDGGAAITLCATGSNTTGFPEYSLRARVDFLTE